MKIIQLSLFLENKPGQLLRICQILAQAQLNLVTLCLADTQQFGILRLILRDWQKAKELLEAHGFVATTTEVVAIEVEDRPGGMARILEILAERQINIEYLYAFTFKRGDKAVVVFRFDRPDEAIAALQQSGQNVLGPVEIYGDAA
ncbi:MAG: ACT domain-containing protein [Thermogutta sp.]|nr:ACT domain-containing protein [Thermogutta sp.]HOP76828.1 ACT domain-containing protein [Thermogutta sp.]HPU06749.1 ACT domain-containing protein [Thermogutta sp.]HQF12897.1 ACT domain-containing protein [Thermogutta sp.]